MGRGKVAWGGVGLSRVEYHGTDAQASLTSGRRPSGVGGLLLSFVVRVVIIYYWLLSLSLLLLRSCYIVVMLVLYGDYHDDYCC